MRIGAIELMKVADVQLTRLVADGDEASARLLALRYVNRDIAAVKRT